VKGLDNNAVRTLNTYNKANARYKVEESKTFVSAIMARDTTAYFNLCGPLAMRALSDALAVNATISDLMLIFRGIGPEGALALAHALVVNQTLESLDLCHNLMGDIGADYIVTALMPNRSMQFNRSITFIRLSENNMTAQGKSVIKEKIEKVNEWRRANNIPEVRIEY
jgi:Ran GTPase-activating protein (RanGAP) involved in mRNA processing and transport